MNTVAEPDPSGRYAVDLRSEDGAWRVAIVRDGADVSVRACRDGDEARAYASTVRQHLAWLSEPKFREYYRLPQEA